jgi:hypothetical protein
MGGHAARLVGMQFYDAARATLGIADDTDAGFADYFCRIGRALGDDTRWRRDGGAIVIEQSGMRLLRGVDCPSPALLDSWNDLWQGACAAHDRRLILHMEGRAVTGQSLWRWRLEGGDSC